MDAVDVTALRARFTGEVVLPGDTGYDAARAVWNASVDRHPAAVARCTGDADVQTAVRWARESRLLVAVRGGGHNVAGNGTCDDGLVVDLSRMRRVAVDAARRTVRCEGGATWADVDAAGAAHGLATPGGLVSTTGVGGLALGGGFGWLSRRHGLTCDNLVGADLVTAEGRLLHVSEHEHPELFWGLRGGGGNFGVVTGFELRAHRLPGPVLGGYLVHPARRLPEVVELVTETMRDAPDDLMTVVVARKAPPAPWLPMHLHGVPVVMIGVCHAGPDEQAEAVLRPLRRYGPPLVDFVRPRAYPEMQRLTDGSWAKGLCNYWKSEHLRGVPDRAADSIADALGTITSPLSDVELAFLSGAVSRVPADATAYPHRAPAVVLNVNARWVRPAEAGLHTGWARDLWKQLRPWSTGAVYVNFLGEEGADRVRAAYGPSTYARLSRLKARYDPDNFFRVNQNIPPVRPSSATRARPRARGSDTRGSAARCTTSPAPD